MLWLGFYTLASLAIGIWCENNAKVDAEHPAIRTLWALAFAVLWPVFVGLTVWAVVVKGQRPEDLEG